MKTKILVATCVALTSVGTFAYAGDNDSKVTGAAGGAVTGAIIGGPVGAVIGGAAGLTVGAALDHPPRKVVTYVEEQPIPQERIVVQEPIVVGRPLPGNVIIQQVPDNDRYAYAIVNDQRVIVEPRTKRVIEVIK
jgi:hypothetical protein